MKVTLELDKETAWALSELTGEENLETSVEIAIDSYIRRERLEKVRALEKKLPDLPDD